MTTEPEWRDMSVPYTAEELEQVRSDFRSMPTYKNGFVGVENIPELFKSLRYYRTPSQLKYIHDFWVFIWNGGIMEDVYIPLASQLHLTSVFAQRLTKETDTNRDGFLSEDEFKTVIAYLAQHDGTFSGKTFEDFVVETDINKSGLVDLEKATAWIVKQYSDIAN